eukprot:TRINITY_DN7680_c0_g1_i3.p1 TRINITY_DN7680_c0_g1~~TRINITY_DN7680_c0_g1_i3.p1  ORF type:complete len:643 (+),score=151.34 TRINITY_DN7680_c0_g1_i3:82-2010(+)
MSLLFGARRAMSSLTGGFDVLVVGGGHAGCEAAAAASRLGMRTALVTQKLETIGEMSCNPSFGGIGKGTLLREIDALGGVSPSICDDAGIHFRMLNRSKGPAVWGPRAQIDRDLYRSGMQTFMRNLQDQGKLSLIPASVEDVVVKDGAINGVVLGNGETIHAQAVVLTTGTFLRGEIHIGPKRIPAGRKGEGPSVGLARTLEDFGFRMGRLRTGTPPRLLASTIDYTGLVAQPSESPATPFSYLNERVKHEGQFVECHMTHTNAQAHQYVLDTLDQNEHIQQDATGPRYCPSIESKVLRFKDRQSHQIWLEPEGLNSDVVYPNGISMTMPEEAQEAFIRAVPGLENAQITQYGYGVAYDYIDPRQLRSSLETRPLANLFLAGQINGTTGYEEAACQGLMAGINAALKVRQAPAFELDRATSYIGVLIDDLTTNGVVEPYRMFTSRAEYRLSLRSDNADLRLTDLGHKIGVVDDARHARMQAVQSELEVVHQLLQGFEMSTHQWIDSSLLRKKLGHDGRKRNALIMLGQRFIDFEGLRTLIPALQHIDDSILTRVEIEGLYSDLLVRQQASVAAFRNEDSLPIPEDLDYSKVDSIPTEARERLAQYQPRTLGQAAKIQGVTPASLVVLMRLAKMAQQQASTQA